MTVPNCSHAEVGSFFRGLEPIAPGIVSITDWHPELAEGETPPGEGPV
ncbi:SAM-dependent methyltransferase [Streptomyces sp. cg40]